MTLRFHEISEANHRILNPFTHEKLMLLGDICQLEPGTRLLDLACGKGELLAQWALKYDIIGVGVDISPVFLEAARQRADELDVLGRLTFVQDDAANYPQEHHEFDVVSCIGATWIGGGLLGTLELMRKAVKDKGGLLLVGEPYWIDLPPPEAYAALEVGEDEFTTLDGTFRRFDAAGMELVEMVMANHDSWDRYEAKHWMTVTQWLKENPNDPDGDALREWNARSRRSYLQYSRRYFGWGVFVLRPVELKMAHKPLPAQQRVDPDQPVSVEIRDGMIWARLHDGRIIANPLDWYPWLADAPPEQQRNSHMGQASIEWDDLGKSLSISEMLRARP
jgi:SAM-dependent methyltransferase